MMEYSENIEKKEAQIFCFNIAHLSGKFVDTTGPTAEPRPNEMIIKKRSSTNENTARRPG
jgi:hypothetical protein